MYVYSFYFHEKKVSTFVRKVFFQVHVWLPPPTNFKTSVFKEKHDLQATRNRAGWITEVWSQYSQYSMTICFQKSVWIIPLCAAVKVDIVVDCVRVWAVKDHNVNYVIMPLKLLLSLIECQLRKITIISPRLLMLSVVFQLQKDHNHTSEVTPAESIFKKLEGQINKFRGQIFYYFIEGWSLSRHKWQMALLQGNIP